MCACMSVCVCVCFISPFVATVDVFKATEVLNFYNCRNRVWHLCLGGESGGRQVQKPAVGMILIWPTQIGKAELLRQVRALKQGRRKSNWWVRSQNASPGPDSQRSGALKKSCWTSDNSLRLLVPQRQSVSRWWMNEWLNEWMRLGSLPHLSVYSPQVLA